jgi:TatD DNase family protein
MEAYTDAIKILKERARVRGNVHFFAGTLSVAQEFWSMGYTTSFTGVITFTHDYDEVVKHAPIEMLHAETDAPYVSPVPFRGKRNEPLHVREVYKHIAAIRGENEEVIREALLKNAEDLFKISL